MLTHHNASLSQDINCLMLTVTQAAYSCRHVENHLNRTLPESLVGLQ